MKKSKIVRYSVGIDEVGRGSLAGPVAVAAALIPKNLKIGNKELKTLRDSKKLSAIQREKWFKYFTNHPQISFAVSKVYPRKIEKINISSAANLAALRAYKKLTSNFKYQTSSTAVFLDGGLYLGSRKSQIANCQSISAKTVIRGDEKITAIKIASIIAKVSRDAQMRRLAKKYPSYGFEIHKGYGTKAHLAALKKFGPSEIHRQTFLS